MAENSSTQAPDPPSAIESSHVQLPESGSVGCRMLFLAFLKIGLLGFGGVAPWVYRVIVEERRWLSETEYASLLGVCQILPGPNTVNVAVMIGDRFQGPTGALVTVGGLMALPLVVLVILAMLFEHFQGVADVHAAISTTAAAAAGIIIGVAARMAWRTKLNWGAALFGFLVFVAVGLLQFPLTTTVLALAPLSIVWSAVRRKP